MYEIIIVILGRICYNPKDLMEKITNYKNGGSGLMLKIAHCDDNKADRTQVMIALTQIEERWGKAFEIYSFGDGESLCRDLHNNHYDIILLDICMDNGMDGIEVSKKIRSLGVDSMIIFISSYDNRWRELIGFRTIGFIDKPVQVERLEEELIKAYKAMRKDGQNIFLFHNKGIPNHIPISDIVYFESRRNQVFIYTTKESYSFYDTLSAVWQRLAIHKQFIMPHRSFIFNLKFVNIQGDKIEIKATGKQINIGAKYRQDTYERYVGFVDKRFLI